MALPFGLVDVLILVVILGVIYTIVNRRGKKAPPMVPALLPYFGNIVEFGLNPVAFVQKNAKKYGDVFTATILGKKMTFLTHPRVYDTFFKAYDDELAVKEVYRFMTPVFGKGVVYDATTTELMMEQLKFVTSSFTQQRFKYYVGIFEEECKLKIDQLGDSGVMPSFDALADLIIYTASRCLLGNEIRKYLTGKNLGAVYHDIDVGINPLSFFYPWFPSSRRDTAVAKVRTMFQELIDTRRRDKIEGDHEDVLHVLMESNYRNGSKVPDEHIIGILIAGLFAGQHTSSIASTWTLLLIISHPDIYKRVMEEQKKVFEGNLHGDLTFEKVKEMELLENCLREALRMYPPLIMLMRYVKKNRECGNYIIPAGDILVVSPSVTGRVADAFPNPDAFDPDRYSESRSEHEKYNHANLAFGSGRHKCVGENFALLQVKSIMSVMLRNYHFEMKGPLPKLAYESLVVGPSPPYNVEYKKRTSF